MTTLFEKYSDTGIIFGFVSMLASANYEFYMITLLGAVLTVFGIYKKNQEIVFAKREHELEMKIKEQEFILNQKKLTKDD